MRQEVGVDEVPQGGGVMKGEVGQAGGSREREVQESGVGGGVQKVEQAEGEPAEEEKNSSDVKRESEVTVVQDGETVEGVKTEEGQPDEMDQDGDDDQDDDGDNDQDQDDENNPDSMDLDTPGRAHPAHPKRVPGGKGGGRNKKPFAFRKKPLGHLLTTIIGNLRRKDAYGLFFDPVSLEEYPNYFEVIGGENRAMDLGTMEDKVGRGGYRSMKEFEVSRRCVIQLCGMTAYTRSRHVGGRGQDDHGGADVQSGRHARPSRSRQGRSVGREAV